MNTQNVETKSENPKQTINNWRKKPKYIELGNSLERLEDLESE